VYGKPEAPNAEEQKKPTKEPAKASGAPVLNSAPVESESFSIPDINLDMLCCKTGNFMIAIPEHEKSRKTKETQQEITLTKGFYLGKYEVTQKKWEKMMGSNPSHFKGAILPVEKVSWNDAMQSCQKLTQAEKAAA